MVAMHQGQSRARRLWRYNHVSCTARGAGADVAQADRRSVADRALMPAVIEAQMTHQRQQWVLDCAPDT